MDRVSDYLAQWRRERPDLDVSPMGVVGRITRAEELLTRQTRAYFADHGLQSGEFDVLATLRRAGGDCTLTPGALAESTMTSSAAITHRMSRLESKGLLLRRTDPDNRRQVLVALTEAGRALVDEVVGGHVANERRLLAVLSEAEQHQLSTLLERFLAASGDTSRTGGQRPP